MWALAWRNIWRNRRRTVITLVAVGLNTAVLIVTYGLLSGINEQLVRRATGLVVGDVQIHAAGYLADRSLYKDIPNPGALLRQADAQRWRAVARAYGVGLLAHAKKSAGAIFWGVDPGRERRAFRLASALASGAFVDDESRSDGLGGVVLGGRLARSLDVGVGDELVAVVQAADGSIGNALFHVVGVLKSAGDDIDRGAAILHHGDFERLFVSGGRIHEIALRGPQSAGVVASVFHLSPGLQAKTWREILPLLSDMLRLQGSLLWLFNLIFLLAAGLGVMNTMLMATHDRVREFGVLKALGAHPWRIMRDVALEAWMLSAVASSIGLGIGMAANFYFQRVGIDLTAVGGNDLRFGGVAYEPIWRASVDAWGLLVCIGLMWVVCVVASLYPAIRVARLNPVAAMTHV